MTIKTVLSDNSHHTGIHWVLVHHYDWDIPWESQYDSQGELLIALRNEPGGEAFRVVPRPTKRGERLYAWREF